MKRLLIAIALIAASAWAQSEVIHVIHSSGPLPAQTYDMLPETVHLTPGTGTGIFTMGRIDPFAGTGDLSGLPIPLVANITGSTSAQSINIGTTVGIPTSAFSFAYLVIDGGTALQEVLQVQGVIDSTHVLAVVRLNHTAGAVVRLVFSSYSKHLTVNWATLPMGGLVNLGFLRMGALPPNVFDQYRIQTVSGTTCNYQEDRDIPWYSGIGGTPYSMVPQYDPTALASSGNPTNAIVIDAGPVLPGGQINCIQVQLLFTATPEPPTGLISYQYWWEY